MPFINPSAGKPRFMVNGANATSPVLGTALKIPFNNVVTDPNGYWDNVNFQWVPKLAGWYEVFLGCSFIWTTGVAGANFSAQLRLNGTTYEQTAATMLAAASSTNWGLFIKSIMQFNGSTDALTGFGFFTNTAGVAGQTFGTAQNTMQMGASYLGG